MRKWMLAGAVITMAAVLAEPTPAQEPVKSPTKTVTSSETVTSSPRMGLLQRLRNRRTTTSAVVTPAKTETTPSTKVTPATTPTTPATTTTTSSTVNEGRVSLLSRLRGRIGR